MAHPCLRGHQDRGRGGHADAQLAASLPAPGVLEAEQVPARLVRALQQTQHRTGAGECGLGLMPHLPPESDVTGQSTAILGGPA